MNTFIGKRIFRRDKETENSTKTVVIQNTYQKMKFTGRDWICMILITIIYSVFALTDLGVKKAPESQKIINDGRKQITIDLGSTKTVSKMSYFNGNYEKREYDIYVWEDSKEEWIKVTNIVMESVFAWKDVDINTTGRYFCLVAYKEPSAINELFFWDQDNKWIQPVVTEEVKALFDEQNTYPGALSYRNSTYFDEVYFARTAYEFNHGLTTYETTHPPLGKIFIALGVHLFGMNPFGWRIVGTIFGIAMVPIMYMISLELFRKRRYAIAGSLLFAFDFMHFTQTRIATIDVYAVFFIMLMYYFMLRYIRTSFYDTSLKKTFLPLGLCGFIMGCAIASKWTGVYASLGLAFLFFRQMYIRFREYRYAKSDPTGSTNGIDHSKIIATFGPNFRKTILFCIGAFVVIPFCIYLLSYLPFISYDGDKNLLHKMLMNQKLMLTYHAGVHSSHPYSSKWYTWPFDYRPILYYYGRIAANKVETISAMGNPVIWWAGILALFYCIYRIIRKKDKIAIFLVVGFASQYLPWMFISRTLFIYHYFASTIFIVLMVVYCLSRYVEEKKKKSRIILFWGYLIIAVSLFLLYYPVLAGKPIDYAFAYKWLKWFKSWPVA
jgi:dolichyl-phosphate-mannose-protein mannosyltransferase